MCHLILLDTFALWGCACKVGMKSTVLSDPGNIAIHITARLDGTVHKFQELVITSKASA